MLIFVMIVVLQVVNFTELLMPINFIMINIFQTEFIDGPVNKSFRNFDAVYLLNVGGFICLSTFKFGTFCQV